MKNKIIFKTLMLKGEAGSTIVSMEKTGHVGTADIYTITFNDGSTTEISLENMSAITSVEKTSSTDTEDIYTITCADGSTQTFSVLNHNADIAAMSDDIDTIDARVDNFINSVVPNTVETLWTGSIQEVGDSATLSKAVSNFDYIDLYLLGSADSKYIRVPSSQTGVQIQQQNLSDDASSNFLRLWEMGVSISGTTVSITKSIAWAWDDPDNSNPTVTANAQNSIPITRIDGVKVASDTPAEVTDIRVGANGITYASAGDAVRGQYTELNDKLAHLFFSAEISNTVSGTKAFNYATVAGNKYKFTNTGDKGVQVRFADSENTTLQSQNVSANTSAIITSQYSAHHINIWFGGATTVIFEDLSTEIGQVEADLDTLAKTFNVFDMLELEQGAITINGEYTDLTTRLRTINTLQGTFKCTCPDGIIIYNALYFDSNGYIDSYTSVNAQSATITVPNGTFCKLIFAKTNTSQDLTVEEVKSSYVLENHESRITQLESNPLVQFTFDHNLDSGIDAIVAEKQYERNSQSMANIYSYFDALVDNDYVTRVDLAEEMDISYPNYANGVDSSDPTYLETPAYKTYMYKFICSNNKVNSALMQKKKIILVGGTHGDEAASPFNLYLFCQRLCNDYLTDDNIYKLRSAFDFYVVPCLNGYGMIHTQRTNANGVDLNRNFPIHSWYVNGSGTINYTGATAGSEFETQLIMALVDDVSPDMLIDAHNYSYNLNTQFYTDMWNKKQLSLAYQALADLSYVCKKEYPQYFGSNFDFVNNAGAAPSVTADVLGYMARWGYEKHIPFSATVEIGDCITYNNGSHAGKSIDYYGDDTFKIAEYTLRNQILHYGQWVLDNIQ